jgi:hypothetical protein
MRSDGLVLEHSVDVPVTPDFAWEIRTDVSTWNDPPARFSIEGAFMEGARGTTLIPGQDPLRWVIGLVVPGRSFVVEVLLEGALLSFEWHFDALADQGTRMTQRIRLSGENAEAYVAQVQRGFGPTLVEGMNRIAEQLIEAEAVHRAQPDSGYEALLRLIQNRTRQNRS